MNLRLILAIASLVLISSVPINASETSRLGNVERTFQGDCKQIEASTRTYLGSRGFTKSECEKCPLDSMKILLDAKGKEVGTLRIRTHLVKDVPFSRSFFIWSTPLHASVSVSTKAEPPGCRLGLTINFNSLHRMVFVVIPVNEALVLPSNGILESEYLAAIQTLLSQH